MLQLVVVPACFLVAGLIGYRLGTPSRVAGGLVAVGCAHLLAFLADHQALATVGAAASWLHLAAVWLFFGGFLGLVWIAAVYPDARPSRALLAVSGLVVLVVPLLAAMSGPTPAVIDDTRTFDPIVEVLPSWVADAARASLMLLPLTAAVTFVVRLVRANAQDRAAMRWPIAGVALIALLAVAGTVFGSTLDGAVTFLFLLGAPIFPLSVAFGPVSRRIDSLADDVTTLSRKLHLRPAAPPGILARLTPRELTVLQAMADGKSNPEIARSLHLSLSSVEKHATSIFRKFDISDAPETHRRVSAVVTYRDAIEGASDSA